MSLNGSPVATYTWDDKGRLEGIQHGSQSFGFGYDSLSRRTSLTYPNGLITTYAFDDQSRLTSLMTKLGTTPITSFGYTYDGSGNRLTKTTLDWTETYAYDDEDRLKSVDRSSGTPNRWRFGYDAAGNRTSEQTGDTALSATIGPYNRLMSRQAGGNLTFGGTLSEPAAVTVQGQPAPTSGTTFQGQTPVTTGTNTVAVKATDPSGNLRTNTYQVAESAAAATYHYDANGNLDQKVEGSVTWTYEWNATNQLKRVLSNGVEVALYSYDPLGRRVEKVAGGLTTSYVYDGMDILRENRGGTISTYIHGPGIDEPLAKEAAGTLSYLHADGLGSVFKTTDQAGAATSTIRYEAWGNLESGTPVLYAFTGREWEPESGLYYYRARYYDPKAGRFISEDPIGFAGGENVYEYVGGNPVDRVDPGGLTWRDNWRMFWGWVTGQGPSNMSFGPRSPQVADLLNSPGINNARAYYCQKNAADPGFPEPVTNFDVSFDLLGFGVFAQDGLINAGLNPTRQFVGSYTVDIYPTQTYDLHFVVTNTTSMTSFLGQAGFPSWEKGYRNVWVAPIPFGNFTQTYTWTESCRCNK